MSTEYETYKDAIKYLSTTTYNVLIPAGETRRWGHGVELVYDFVCPKGVTLVLECDLRCTPVSNVVLSPVVWQPDWVVGIYSRFETVEDKISFFGPQLCSEFTKRTLRLIHENRVICAFTDVSGRLRDCPVDPYGTDAIVFGNWLEAHDFYARRTQK